MHHLPPRFYKMQLLFYYHFSFYLYFEASQSFKVIMRFFSVKQENVTDFVSVDTNTRAHC